jgi:hypothetical protein
LIKDSSVPEADKAYIRNLLTKPYVQRHSHWQQNQEFWKRAHLGTMQAGPWQARCPISSLFW